MQSALMNTLISLKVTEFYYKAIFFLEVLYILIRVGGGVAVTLPQLPALTEAKMTEVRGQIW